MTEQIKPIQLLSALELPKRELHKFSFVKSAKPTAVIDWLDSLRATQVMSTAKQLYRAIPEVSRLNTDADTRFEMLEHFRPSIQYNIMGLEKKFLRQPLVMPESAQKAAALAQALQKHMVDAYVVNIVQTAENNRSSRNNFDLLTKSIHRAMVGISLIFFRNCQIYAGAPARLWTILHTLYRVADYYELTKSYVQDPLFSGGRPLRVEEAYCLSLMLDVARTNQLTQHDIQIAYSAFGQWCEAVKISQGLSDDSDSFFAVDLDSDDGPVYKSTLKGVDRQKTRLIELNFKPLLKQLKLQTGDSEEIFGASSNINVPKDLSAELLTHLTTAWSSIAHRKYDRRALASVADVCIGLSDCHYFICNEQDFDTFLRSASISESQRPTTAKDTLSDHDGLNVQGNFTNMYRVSIQNISAGGFCLFWQKDPSNKVKTGELIGIREVGKRIWSIGIIRWVRQLRNASRLGVELLSDKAKPYAVARHDDNGRDTSYMRAMLLPPSKLGQQRPTLLTTAAPLSENNKVALCDGEKTWQAKLEQQHVSTKRVQLLGFKNQEPGTDQAAEKKAQGKSFDSNWE